MRESNRRAVLGRRGRFRTVLDALADMVPTVVEGGIVPGKAPGEAPAVVGQILLVRQSGKQAFLPPVH